MNAKFATCCILAFNRPQFLQTMIATMVAHAGHPMEVIVHDDGSTNEEQRLWLHHMVDQGRISTLIENPPGHNQGQGVALNRMFTMAKGDPIIKLDHDLIFREGWLREAVDVLTRNEQRTTVNDEAFLHPEAVEGVEPRIGALGLFRYHSPPVRYQDMHIRGWDGWDEVADFVGSAMVIPRLAWEEFGPFEEHSAAFAEDAVFKQWITARDSWCCALTERDMVENQGFGVGPSTLVLNDDHDLQQFHTEPKLIYPGVPANRVG